MIPCRQFLAIVLVASVLPWSAHADSRLLLYDPDANHQMMVQIAELFNRYMKSVNGEVAFQPIDSLSVWQSFLAQPESKYAIVPLEFAQKVHGLKFSPLLVPEVQSSVYYQKHLIDLGSGTAGDLKHKSIAATVNAEDSGQVLDLLARGQVNVEGAFVISVAKDVDALLALAFGQADAALVTPLSIQVLQRINPTVAGKFRQVFTTKKIMRAPLCAISSRSNDAGDKHIKQLMLELNQSDSGKELLRSMAVDRWIPYQADMVSP